MLLKPENSGLFIFWWVLMPRITVFTPLVCDHPRQETAYRSLGRSPQPPHTQRFSHQKFTTLTLKTPTAMERQEEQKQLVTENCYLIFFTVSSIFKFSFYSGVTLVAYSPRKSSIWSTFSNLFAENFAMYKSLRLLYISYFLVSFVLSSPITFAGKIHVYIFFLNCCSPRELA